MRGIFAVTLAALSLCAPAWAGEGGAQPALAVRIVSPDRHRGEGPQLITLHQPSQQFHVVVTNVSGKPLRLWREWCSWGYYMLSFRVTGEDGETVTVKKAARGWSKNYPDWNLLQPGDHMVYEVSFDKKTWPNGPLPQEGKLREVKMSAVIEVEADAESKREDVWTGKVASPERTYKIAR